MKKIALSLGFTEAQLENKTDDEIQSLIEGRAKDLTDTDKVIDSLVKKGLVNKKDEDDDEGEDKDDKKDGDKVTMKMHNSLKKEHDKLKNCHNKLKEDHEALADKVRNMSDGFKKMAKNDATIQAEKMADALLAAGTIKKEQRDTVIAQATENYKVVAALYDYKTAEQLKAEIEALEAELK